MRKQPMGIVGAGKIARDQHIPSLLADRAYQFAAASSRHAQAADIFLLGKRISVEPVVDSSL